jgi:hypothetical protein
MFLKTSYGIGTGASGADGATADDSDATGRICRCSMDASTSSVGVSFFARKSITYSIHACKR